MSKHLRSKKNKRAKCIISWPAAETLIEKAKKRKSDWHDVNNTRVVQEVVNTVRDSIENTYDNLIGHAMSPHVMHSLEEAVHRRLQYFQELGIINSIGDVQVSRSSSRPSVVDIGFSIAPRISQEYINITLATDNREEKYERIE